MRLIDRIAYVNHDIEDALRAGVHRAPGTCRPEEVAVLGATTSERLTTLVADIVGASAERRARSASRRRSATAFLRLRRFMFQSVYLAPPASDEAERARGVVRALFGSSSSTRTVARRRRSRTGSPG